MVTITTTDALRLGLLTCAAAALLACGDSPTGGSGTGPESFVLSYPDRFPDPPIPADNPMTVEGVALGQRLFFDPILSVDSTVACASCHDPAVSFSDPIEMGETWENVEQKLRAHPDYPGLFDGAFPGEPITRDHVAKAIAQFERTLISAGSRYDRFLDGQTTLDESETLGVSLFFSDRGDCFHCHGTSMLTDNRFHNNGLDAAPPDSGRAEVTGLEEDIGSFRTPSLRNVELTPPYMHDGRFATLEEVLDHYDSGMHRDRRLDPLLLATPDPRAFTTEERDALIAFMRTLTDDDFIAQHR